MPDWAEQGRGQPCGPVRAGFGGQEDPLGQHSAGWSHGINYKQLVFCLCLCICNPVLHLLVGRVGRRILWVRKPSGNLAIFGENRVALVYRLAILCVHSVACCTHCAVELDP